MCEPTYYLVEYAAGKLARDGGTTFIEAKDPEDANNKFGLLVNTEGWRQHHKGGHYFPTRLVDVGVRPVCNGPGNYGKPCQGCMTELRGE